MCMHHAPKLVTPLLNLIEDSAYVCIFRMPVSEDAQRQALQ